MRVKEFFNGKETLVDLTMKSIRDVDMEELSNLLMEDTTVIELILAANSIHDKSIPLLVKALESNSTLEKLDLKANYITDSGAEQLIQLLKFSNGSIKCIDVESNPVSPAMIEKIQHLLQDEEENKKRKLVPEVEAAAFSVLPNCPKKLFRKQHHFLKKEPVTGLPQTFSGEFQGKQIHIHEITLKQDQFENCKNFIASLGPFQSVSHVNVSNLLGFACYSENNVDSSCIVLQFITEASKSSLKQYLEDEMSKFDAYSKISKIAKFILQISSGLNQLHKNGMINGMIKTENIFMYEISGKLTPKIEEFGFFAVRECVNNPESKIVGNISQKNDISSLGIVFLEILVNNNEDFTNLLEKKTFEEDLLKKYPLAPESMKKSAILFDKIMNDASSDFNTEQFVEEITGILQTLEKEVSVFPQKLNESNEMIQSHKQYVSETEEKLKNKDAEIENLQQQLAKMTEEKNQLSELSEKQKTEIQQLQEDASKKDAELETLRNENEEMKKKLPQPKKPAGKK